MKMGFRATATGHTGKRFTHPAGTPGFTRMDADALRDLNHVPFELWRDLNLPAPIDVEGVIATMPELPWELDYWDGGGDPAEREPRVLLTLKRRLYLISRAKIEDEVEALRNMEAIGAKYRDDVTVALSEEQGNAFQSLLQRLRCDLPGPS